MRKYILAFLFVFPLTSFTQSQDSTLLKTTNNYAISAMYQNGYVFPTNDFVRGSNTEKELINAFQTISIRFSKQSFGENWDTYSHVPFWKKLDYIGVDAYFPLSDAANFTAQDLEAAWEKHKREIEFVSLKNNSPILFTEYGYRSCDYAAKEPWTNDKHPVNPDNQKIALEALFNSFWDESWFIGGFLWKRYDNTNAGGENNSDYTPQNKPAEKIIRDVYEKQE